MKKAGLRPLMKSYSSRKLGERYLLGIKSRMAPQVTVAVDPKYFRPTEVDLLIGDPTKSKTKLGWEPQYDLNGLIKDMMQSDIKLMKKDAWLREGGYRDIELL